MDNQNDMLGSRYNPFTDPSFLIALVFGGGSLVLNFLSGTSLSHPVFITNDVFFVVWQFWIFFKKGKKWSLAVGFVIALIVSGLAMVELVQIDLRKVDVQRQRALQQIDEKIRQQQTEQQKAQDAQMQRSRQQMEENIRQRQIEQQGPPR